MSQTFMSKYKPYFIKEFHLDPDFVSVLNTMFELDDLNLLVIGQPNSGKSTFLYAIIREYYNLKREDRIPETNILFINTLKEQGIQFFRTEMKTFCRSKCTVFGRKKLIIIDDMDTINEQSQQVFRNYIDKYKHNVNFIAVCTNIQKIIESIQSRLHIVSLPYLKSEQMMEIMDHIVAEEGIQIDTESKQYLLKNSGNSIRNIINNLEKMYILDKPIDLIMCKNICLNINRFEEYMHNLLHHNDLYRAVDILMQIYDYGFSVIDILDHFFHFMKTTDLISEEQKYRILPVICNYTVVFHSIHEDPIELAMLTNELLCVISQK